MLRLSGNEDPSHVPSGPTLVPFDGQRLRARREAIVYPFSKRHWRKYAAVLAVLLVTLSLSLKASGVWQKPVTPPTTICQEAPCR